MYKEILFCKTRSDSVKEPDMKLYHNSLNNFLLNLRLQKSYNGPDVLPGHAK